MYFFLSVGLQQLSLSPCQQEQHSLALMNQHSKPIFKSKSTENINTLLCQICRRYIAIHILCCLMFIWLHADSVLLGKEPFYEFMYLLCIATIKKLNVALEDKKN